MNHTGTVKIETKRLLLRQFIERDSLAAFNNWTNDEKVTESQHDPNNPNSGKVMIKCGLKYEGILRQADYSNKGIVDATMYSLLASEYYATK